MGINPINMQMSVPRTPEVSNMQQQLTMRPMIDQSMLESASVKETEKSRSTTSAVDETENEIIRNQERNQNQHSKKEKNKKQSNNEQENETIASHPYKGKHFDLRL